MIKLTYKSGDTHTFLYDATKYPSASKLIFMHPDFYEEHLLHVEDNDKLYKQAMKLEFLGGWKILRSEDLEVGEVVFV